MFQVTSSYTKRTKIITLRKVSSLSELITKLSHCRIQSFNKSRKFRFFHDLNLTLSSSFYTKLGNYISFPFCLTKPLFLWQLLCHCLRAIILPNFLFKTMKFSWSLLTWKTSLQTTKHFISCLLSCGSWKDVWVCLPY